MNGELNFFVKIKKKIWGGGGVGGVGDQVGGGSGWWGGWVRVDVNEELKFL